MAHIKYKNGVYYVERVVVSVNLEGSKCYMSCLVRKRGGGLGQFTLTAFTKNVESKLMGNIVSVLARDIMLSDTTRVFDLENIATNIQSNTALEKVSISTTISDSDLSNNFSDVLMEVPIKNRPSKENILKMTSIDMYRLFVDISFERGKNHISFTINDALSKKATLGFDLKEFGLVEKPSLRNEPVKSRYKLVSTGGTKSVADLADAVEMHIKREIYTKHKERGCANEKFLMDITGDVIRSFGLNIQ